MASRTERRRGRATSARDPRKRRAVPSVACPTNVWDRRTTALRRPPGRHDRARVVPRRRACQHGGPGGRRVSIAEGPDATVATQPPPLGARVLIVSPVRNEAAHIERVVLGVAAQVVPPADWIVFDDASTDDTLAILRSLEQEVPFMR